METGTLILAKTAIDRKIERIAYEIYEQNYRCDELILIGIRRRGTILAKRLKQIIQKISSIQVTGYRVDLNKAAPTEGEIVLNRRLKTDELHDKTIIIVDDVANTGRTLCYAIRPLLEAKSLPKKLQVAVLVDRQHKQFPIQADFVGHSLSTTLQEHIEVCLNEEQEDGVYLR